jgi:hypothetical protein
MLIKKCAVFACLSFFPAQGAYRNKPVDRSLHKPAPEVSDEMREEFLKEMEILTSYMNVYTSKNANVGVDCKEYLHQCFEALKDSGGDYQKFLIETDKIMASEKEYITAAQNVVSQIQKMETTVKIIKLSLSQDKPRYALNIYDYYNSRVSFISSNIEYVMKCIEVLKMVKGAPET